MRRCCFRENNKINPQTLKEKFTLCVLDSFHFLLCLSDFYYLRFNWSQQRGPSVSAAAHPPEETHLQPSSSFSQEAERRASEVLREMGRLKSEMKMLLTVSRQKLMGTSQILDLF